MKKAVAVLMTMAILIGAGKVFASYYEGGKYYAVRTSDGLLAGYGKKCKLKKGQVADVLVHLGRYDLLVVATKKNNSVDCIALVSQT